MMDTAAATIFRLPFERARWICGVVEAHKLMLAALEQQYAIATLEQSFVY